MVICTVIEGESTRYTRFLVFDDFRLILVEPEVSRVGFGIVRLVAAMEHVTVGVSQVHFFLNLFLSPNLSLSFCLFFLSLEL